MTQRNNTPISHQQWRWSLDHAHSCGHVTPVVVDSGTNYIHYYVNGVLALSTKWDYYAQISNEWLAKHGLAQGML